jgi:hypothetical protein
MSVKVAWTEGIKPEPPMQLGSAASWGSDAAASYAAAAIAAVSATVHGEETFHASPIPNPSLVLHPHRAGARPSLPPLALFPPCKPDASMCRTQAHASMWLPASTLPRQTLAASRSPAPPLRV